MNLFLNTNSCKCSDTLVLRILWFGLMDMITMRTQHVETWFKSLENWERSHVMKPCAILWFCWRPGEIVYSGYDFTSRQIPGGLTDHSFQPWSEECKAVTIPLLYISAHVKGNIRIQLLRFGEQQSISTWQPACFLCQECWIRVTQHWERLYGPCGNVNHVPICIRPIYQHFGHSFLQRVDFNAGLDTKVLWGFRPPLPTQADSKFQSFFVCKKKKNPPISSDPLTPHHKTMTSGYR